MVPEGVAEWTAESIGPILVQRFLKCTLSDTFPLCHLVLSSIECTIFTCGRERYYLLLSWCLLKIISDSCPFLRVPSWSHVVCGVNQVISQYVMLIQVVCFQFWRCYGISSLLILLLMYVSVTTNLKNNGHFIITKRFGGHAFHYWHYTWTLRLCLFHLSVVLSSRRSKFRIHKVGKQELTKSIIQQGKLCKVIYLFYLAGRKFSLSKALSLSIRRPIVFHRIWHAL